MSQNTLNNAKFTFNNFIWTASKQNLPFLKEHMWLFKFSRDLTFIALTSNFSGGFCVDICCVWFCFPEFPQFCIFVGIFPVCFFKFYKYVDRIESRKRVMHTSKRKFPQSDLTLGMVSHQVANLSCDWHQRPKPMLSSI